MKEYNVFTDLMTKILKMSMHRKPTCSPLIATEEKKVVL